MSDQIPNHYVEVYNANVIHACQTSKFAFDGKSLVKSCRGKTEYIPTLGAVKARKVTSRMQPTVFDNIDHGNRAIHCFPYENTLPIDEFDEPSLIIDPSSHYVKAQVKAMNVAKNEIFLEAALGSAFGRATGVVPFAPPVTQKVAVDYVSSGVPVNSGLTLDKIIQAKNILGENKAFDESNRLYMAIKQTQLFDMLRKCNQVQSSDYNNIKALYEGTITYFMGVNWVICNEVSVDANDYAHCVMWVDDGIMFGEQKAITSKISTRSDLSDALQVRSTGYWGATRLDEKKVVEIICDQSV